MNITDIRMRKMTNDTKMKAVVSVTIDDEFVIYDIKVIEGENLDVTFGSLALTEGENKDVKSNVLRILKEKYGVEEDDFVSAEIEVVPQG